MTEMWVPRECTLPTEERPLRVAEFDDLFSTSLTALERPEPTRARLALAAEAEPRARELATRESACCSFFTFELHAAADTVWMEVAVPVAQVAVLDALVARAAAARPGTP